MNCIFHQTVQAQTEPLLPPDGGGRRSKEEHGDKVRFEHVQLGQRKEKPGGAECQRQHQTATEGGVGVGEQHQIKFLLYLL